MSGEGDEVIKEAIVSGGWKVKLKSSDGQTFEVDELVAFQSQTVKDLAKDVGSEMTIPLPTITSDVLTKVIEYSKYLVELKKSREMATIPDLVPDDEVRKWYEEFAATDITTLMNLISASDYLKIAPLLNLTTQVIAEVYIAGKSTEELRRLLKIENDFTQEEEAAIVQETKWVFTK